MTAQLYSAGFYQKRREHTAYAAQTVLAALPAGLARRSVADIGCGTGTWLAQALGAGSVTAFGMEGDWVQPEMLDDPRIAFVSHDLAHQFAGPLVDLTISLEVAEHLPMERGESFVANLVAMAPAVLFSAAIPGQGGVGHRNERWQSYWASLFAAHGYMAHDVIRPVIWGNEDIAAWYRQNTVLYLNGPSGKMLGLEPTAPALLDCVHPSFWERANRELVYADALPESEVLARQAAAVQQQ